MLKSSNIFARVYDWASNQQKLGTMRVIFPNFQNRACCLKYLKGIKHNNLHLARKYAHKFALDTHPEMWRMLPSVNVSKSYEGKWITWRITELHNCIVIVHWFSHVLIDKRQSNPLESIKMSTFILWWNLEQMWKHGLFDASSVCECSSDNTRVKLFLTGTGALRENAKDDAPLFSSSPSSMSHAYGVITEKTLIWLTEKQAKGTPKPFFKLHFNLVNFTLATTPNANDTNVSFI